MIFDLVFDGTSQWVSQRNLTSRSNITHLDGNVIELPSPEHTDINVPFTEHSYHLYLQSSLFMTSISAHPMSAASIVPSNNSLPNIKYIIVRVNVQVCDHYSLSDIKIFLTRNDLWNEDTAKYLKYISARCSACRVTSKRWPSRKVPIGSMSKETNQVVCVGHFLIGRHRVFDAMDVPSRYSLAIICDDTSISSSI